MECFVESMPDEIPLLAAVVAHEVKNPLGSLKLFHTLVKDELAILEDVIPPVVFEHLFQMAAGIEAIDMVVNSMLTGVSRVTSRWGPVNIHALLKETALMVAPHLQSSNKELIDSDKSLSKISVSTEGSPFLMGDERALRQAFLNIMVNACEAAGPGGMVEVVCKEQSNQGVEVRVSDTGPGIDLAFLEKVFDPFYSTKINGSGLGLALVQETIRAHRGSIKFDVLRQGSTEEISTSRCCCVVRLPQDGRRNVSVKDLKVDLGG